MDMQSRKYGRTFHYPFSPGTTSDDRINHGWWQDVQKIKHLIHTITNFFIIGKSSIG
ncbi:hypothetical protein XBJ1_3909 [Xenorhabdus bovienii SS-2004]|uniref:Uncharacterized protein n=1 Tax=Xenorhabdus bovienii (strain SS-2004) TaxID=406818 RepID=D3V5U8_XENBS|nr:hypothetical protein XBJ1_3909 [Xenorhabdus bovienii SS-2004]